MDRGDEFLKSLGLGTDCRDRAREFEEPGLLGRRFGVLAGRAGEPDGWTTIAAKMPSTALGASTGGGSGCLSLTAW